MTAAGLLDVLNETGGVPGARGEDDAGDGQLPGPLVRQRHHRRVGGALFDRGMACGPLLLDDVPHAYDFGDARPVVNVADGDGSPLAAALEAHPRLRGVLMDRPTVAGGTRARLAERGPAERCEVTEGDFFTSVPSGGNAFCCRASCTTGTTTGA